MMQPNLFLILLTIGACTEIVEETDQLVVIDKTNTDTEELGRTDETNTDTDELEHTDETNVETEASEHIDETDADTKKLEQIEEAKVSESSASNCDEVFYTHSPVDLDQITDITPLGNANPPGHTIPTEHTYIHIDKERGSTETVPLMSPGDIVITSITSGDDFSAKGRTEYVIRFSLCDEVDGYFNHVKGISEEVESALADVECQRWDHNPGNACEKRLSYNVKGGTVIGEVGHIQGNFDFGTIDYRVLLDYVNPDRFGTFGDPPALHKVCPYDYYDEPLKSLLHDKLEGPDCGEVMQDVPGTLAGNWYFKDSTFTDPNAWSGQLAFTRNNVDPDMSMIVVGGTFTESGSWMFEPEKEGTFNREFSQVNDREIYCYEGVDPRVWIDPARRDDAKWDGRIIVQLSDDELQIEWQDGSCSGNYEFNEPTLYDR